MDETFYMHKALEMAQQAADADEVPIGAVVVNPKNGEILGAAYNLSEHSADATAHAEILAMRQACQKLGSNRLRDMDLYVTLEPCTMCAAAISFMRIRKLFFGATDIKGGAVISGVKFYDAATCHHKPLIENGILEEECAKILKSFFASKRKKD
jgi:tRNA(adenine34) deaminase